MTPLVVGQVAGRDVILKEASEAAGCQVHEVPAASLAKVVIGLLARPGGVNVCTPCLIKARAALRGRGAAR